MWQTWPAVYCSTERSISLRERVTFGGPVVQEPRAPLAFSIKPFCWSIGLCCFVLNDQSTTARGARCRWNLGSLGLNGEQQHLRCSLTQLQRRLLFLHFMESFHLLENIKFPEIIRKYLYFYLYFFVHVFFLYSNGFQCKQSSACVN